MVLLIQVIFASESNIPVPVNYLPWKLCKPEVCSYASQNGPTNDVFDANKEEITRNGLVFTFQEHLLPACEHFRGVPPFFVLSRSSTPLKRSVSCLRSCFLLVRALKDFEGKKSFENLHGR